MKQNNEYFIFDSHSRNTKGEKISDGTSVLMKFITLNKLKSYIRHTYEHKSFQILPKIITEDFNILKSAVLKRVKRRQKQISKRKKARQCTKNNSENFEKLKESRRKEYKEIKEPSVMKS